MKTLGDQMGVSAPSIKARLADRYVETLDTALWVFDIDRSCVAWANGRALDLWQAESLEELRARDMGADMSVTVAQRLRQYQEDFEALDATFTELWTLYPNGVPNTVRVIFRGFRLDDGRMAMLCEGLSKFADTPETLRSAEALLHTSVMISLYAIDGIPLYSNPAARACQIDAKANVAARFVDRQEYLELMSRLQRYGECRLAARIRAASGVRWHEITARECRDAVTGKQAFLFSEIDISDLKETEQRVRYLADHDVLTGLANRNYLQNKVPTLIQNAKRRKERLVFLLIDLDRFKAINDTLGHAAGDELLMEVGGRLKATVGSDGIVARLGGDEFLICVEESRTVASGVHIGQRILNCFDRKIRIRKYDLSVTPSIGISTFPDDGDDLSSLLINADLALYAAKDAGKNCFRFFSYSLQSKLDERLALENDLHRAVEAQEFELIYQPRLNAITDEIVGAEALLRWRHPTKGLLSPDLFIGACEELGLIDEVGMWVLNSVAEEQVRLAGRGHDIALSINISPRQLENPNFVPAVLALPELTGCNPERLQLEITESMLMSEDYPIAEYLRRFKEAGFGIAIDDFGTGYSNLAYIQRYPITSLKIDRSFISDIEINGAITAMVISLCKLIGVNSVAEGVEDQAQLDWLRQHECDEYQGYLFSKPVQISRLHEMLKRLSGGPDNVVFLPRAARN